MRLSRLGSLLLIGVVLPSAANGQSTYVSDESPLERRSPQERTHEDGWLGQEVSDARGLPSLDAPRVRPQARISSSSDAVFDVSESELAPLITPAAFSMELASIEGNSPQPAVNVASASNSFDREICSTGARAGWCPVWRDSQANRVFDIFYGYDAWRGVPDGAWTNNGAHAGANLGTRLGRFSDVTGFGLQAGGTVGVYDWAGTDYRLDNQNKPTTQGMLTYGLFRRADERSDWTAAIAHDWMLNANYSVMGEDSVLWQWRGQLGYVLNDSDEWGLWGAWRGHGETQRVRHFGDVTWRPIQQLNLYWHHKWTEGGADTWIMIGLPEKERLAGGGSLGDFIAGANARCPLNDRFLLYSMVNYMHQTARPGDPGAKEESWNFYIGVAFYFQRLARSRTVRGHRWAPLLPVANNGLFLVDASHNY